MNKALVAVVVIAVGVGAGWYYVKGTNTARKPSVPSAQTMPTAQGTPDQAGTTASGNMVAEGTVVVSYTDTGFRPERVTVKKGTAVTFRNDSATNMWVASGVHPTHKLLPGFDELQSVAKGGTYAYTFVKVGTWQYHNHIKPTDVAYIVVVE